MLNKIGFALFLGLIGQLVLSPAGYAAADAETIGQVKTVTGQVNVIREDESTPLVASNAA